MEIIKIPVVSDKKYIVLKKTDIVFELNDDFIEIKVKYLVNMPKKDDEYCYERYDFLNEYQVVIKKETVTYIQQNWDNDNEIYMIDFGFGKTGYAYNFENKQHSLDVYNKLKDWWLKK